MKMRFRLLMMILVILAICENAAAGGYPLREKMEKQLQIGSGLKGSFVVHGNVDKEDYALLESLQNAEYEIRGIRQEENLHYYFFQNGENDTMKALTEICRISDVWFLRSDLLGEQVYQLPSENEAINEILDIQKGENPSILPTILRSFLPGNEEKEADQALLQKLEKLIEVWINGFSAETTFHSKDDGAPRLSLEFRIPTEALNKMIQEMLTVVTSDDTAMASLKEYLNDEEMALYANANLEAFYGEALSKLDLKGDIIFQKTVSTLGEPLEACLIRPLDEEKTGYSATRIENDAENKSFTISGKKGTYSVTLPTSMDNWESGSEKTFRVCRANTVDRDGKKEDNLSLLITIDKNFIESEEEETARTHETEQYKIRAVRDVSVLPEGLTADLFPEMEDIQAQLELHYSSKIELSSPTTLEFAFQMSKGKAYFDVSGKVKTASPWEFLPFQTENAIHLDVFAKDGMNSIREMWMKGAESAIERIPMEIKISQ